VGQLSKTGAQDEIVLATLPLLTWCYVGTRSALACQRASSGDAGVALGEGVGFGGVWKKNS
jgi:hypothetical protein